MRRGHTDEPGHALRRLVAGTTRPRVLVLFPNAWDRQELSRLASREHCELIFHGHDAWEFPRALLFFARDMRARVESIVRRFAGERIDGVLSTDDFIGVSVASLVARRLALPGTDPQRMILAQHKYYARLTHQRSVPEATPPFRLLAQSRRTDLSGIEYPVWAKPVRGTLSALVRRVDDEPALRRRVTFGPVVWLASRAITRPYNQLLRDCPECRHDANWFLIEGPLAGEQVTVDGFAHDGEFTILGIVDSVMYPGTREFERFEYPSRLAPAVQERMADVAKRVARGMGLTHGTFNVELTHDPATDRIGAIELNVRFSMQFADLYEKVDGTNTYDVALALALGRRPELRRRAGPHARATSFVLRRFDGRRVERVPTQEEVDAVLARHPDARVNIYARAGQRMGWQLGALGTFRHAVINLGGASDEALAQSWAEVLRGLPFRFS